MLSELLLDLLGIVELLGVVLRLVESLSGIGELPVVFVSRLVGNLFGTGLPVVFVEPRFVAVWSDKLFVSGVVKDPLGVALIRVSGTPGMVGATPGAAVSIEF